jgi:hypothetical protein
VAIDTPDGLVDRYAGEAEVTFSTDADDLTFLEQVDGVEGVQQEGRRVAITGHGAVLANVAAALVARGHAPTDLGVRRGNLEDAFLRITGEEG